MLVVGCIFSSPPRKHLLMSTVSVAYLRSLLSQRCVFPVCASACGGRAGTRGGPSHSRVCVLLCFVPVPEVVGGSHLTATVIELNPWVEYEFRVLASNAVGTGEPSKPSKKARTKETRECSRYGSVHADLQLYYKEMLILIL